MNYELSNILFVFPYFIEISKNKILLLSTVMCAKPLRHRNVNIKLYINQIYVNTIIHRNSLCERAK